MNEISSNGSQRAVSAGPHRPRRPAEGFTLVEIGVALCIGAIIGLALMTFFRGGARFFKKTSQHLEALQTARMVSEIIYEDLKGMVFLPASETDDGRPDFSPFTYDPAGAERGTPLKLPAPVDLTRNAPDTKLSFYKTIGDPTEGRFSVVKVSYHLEPHEYKGFNYYFFRRTVEGLHGGDKTEYKYRLRVKHLVFVFYCTTRDDIKGEHVVLGKGELPDAGKLGIRSMTQGNGSSANSAQNFPSASKPSKDIVYYVQYFVTGLSSSPQLKKFKEPRYFVENMLMGLVYCSTISERLQKDTGASYWHSTPMNAVNAAPDRMPPNARR